MKVEVSVTESLTEITLGEYKKYLKNQDPNEDPRLLKVKMNEIFGNIT